VRKRFGLVLWDVDETLLTTGGSGRRALADARCAIVGKAFALDGIELPGRPDPEIWRDVAAAHGVDGGKTAEDRFRTTYRECLTGMLSSKPPWLLPGVCELTGRLADRDDIAQGILSGNYPEIGSLKMRRAGLDPVDFPVRAWGTDAAARRDLVSVALARYREFAGRVLDPGQAVVVGDTPRDVECAKASGCRSLAVATGNFSIAALETAGADLVRRDLADTEPILDWIFS
jgi:phosphoglycolate phosphatase